MKAWLKIAWVLVQLVVTTVPGLALISVGNLSEDQARELGIVMKHRGNGDAGILVWLEFKKTGFLEKFTYCELQLRDEKGKHLVSAKLQPRPVVPQQSEDVVSVSFSADRGQLAHCAFMVVAYGSSRGDVGYVLNVKDFLDAKVWGR